MKVKFKRFSSLARVLTKATPGSGCFDVYSARDLLLGPGITKTVDLDLGFKSEESTSVEYIRGLVYL